MTPLELWLNQATRRLCRDSVAKVRSEIVEHYESSREEAIARGASAAEAGRLALAALGDARVANRQYRKALLTSGEARLLRSATQEAFAVCSRPWLRILFQSMPLLGLLASGWAYWTGATSVARVLLIASLGIAPWFLVPFLPVYTPARARFFRGMKWIVMVTAMIAIFGGNALQWSWLIASSLWPLFYIEFTRASIRRKLPVSDWPKPLYL